jgi:spore maturation protein SpmA
VGGVVSGPGRALRQRHQRHPWGFWVISLSTIASFITTAVMAVRRPLTTADRVLIVLLGLIASVVAFVVRILAWLQAAEVACRGGYECPF